MPFSLMVAASSFAAPVYLLIWKLKIPPFIAPPFHHSTGLGCNVIDVLIISVFSDGSFLGRPLLKSDTTVLPGYAPSNTCVFGLALACFVPYYIRFIPYIIRYKTRYIHPRRRYEVVGRFCRFCTRFFLYVFSVCLCFFYVFYSFYITYKMNKTHRKNTHKRRIKNKHT